MRSKRQVHAFSLIELGIVLLVMGVLVAGIFKGKDLLDSAKLHATIQDVQHIQQMVHEYTDLYHALPGDDANATRFGADVQNGNGNKIIDSTEQDLFWIHLFKANLSTFEKNYPCKLGGFYTVEQTNSPTPNIVISLLNQEGVLTPKQAKIIENKLGTQNVQILDGTNSKNECINNGALNLTSTKKACIVKIKIAI